MKLSDLINQLGYFIDNVEDKHLELIPDLNSQDSESEEDFHDEHVEGTIQFPCSKMNHSSLIKDRRNKLKNKLVPIISSYLEMEQGQFLPQLDQFLDSLDSGGKRDAEV